MSAKSVLYISIPSMALWPDVLDVSPQWNHTGEPREHRRYVPERGTCHDILGARWFHCSECGFGIVDMYINDEEEYDPEKCPRYCPWCGRKVVGE